MYYLIFPRMASDTDTLVSILKILKKILFFCSFPILFTSKLFCYPVTYSNMNIRELGYGKKRSS